MSPRAADLHESAVGHVTGIAFYTDDLQGRLHGVLQAWPVMSPHAHARVLGIDADAASTMPGVVRVLTAEDVPGVNDAGTRHDQPLFPGGDVEVMFHSQPVAWALAETLEHARLAAEAVVVDYAPLPSLISLDDAIKAGSFHGAQPLLHRGDVEDGFAEAGHILDGGFEIGGQEHFYLETQTCIAMVDENEQVFVHASIQHPSEMQEIIAHVLGVPSHAVTVQCLRMGGGFGGKEMQHHGFAAVAAIGAVLTGRPVRVRLPRALDIVMTGKRHGYHFTWRAGFTDDGRITALDATMTADGGWCLDLSEAVLERSLCTVDNAYFIPNVRVHGRIAKCHKTSQTAFRGFGAPQGMVLIEEILGQAAAELGIDPGELREMNFYRAGQTTPYGQGVTQVNRLQAVWEQVQEDAALCRRRGEIAAFNKENPNRKRALAMVPIKYGISFTFMTLNQAGALVLVYKDGSVLINHGGTEMGQGLHTKMLQVAATALGVPRSLVRLAPTRTDKVPNTSATAASSGTDLNGGAVKDACEQILGRLRTVAAGLLGCAAEDVRFLDGMVFAPGSETSLTWSEVVTAAYMQRVQLSASGFFRTPGIHWDAATVTGAPFRYFVYGAAAAEVEVNRFDGSYEVRRIDIVHDVGESLAPTIDRGQIEGGFVQGQGWLTLEDLRWDDSDGPGRGRLLTNSAGTYKIPSLSEIPGEMNVHFLDQELVGGVGESAVYGSKAVGEPPFTLSLSVREALREAVAEFGVESGSDARPRVALSLPATPEEVFWAVERVRSDLVIQAVR
ncbi:xanthine dehydrogenase molybdopterin binding subunit [Corynebacterium variabile]|uniref:xanthine dehydrogenase molybdopterin binding subunit n=1 Tax=Actinomycetes TaxID=1760 RepID=UPI003F8FD1DD